MRMFYQIDKKNEETMVKKDYNDIKYERLMSSIDRIQRLLDLNMNVLDYSEKKIDKFLLRRKKREEKELTHR